MSDTCREEGCERPRRSRGYCPGHYMHHYRDGDLIPLTCGCGAPLPHPRSKWCPACRPTCLESDCDSRARTRGYCYRHYNIHFRAGDFNPTKCVIEGCVRPGVYEYDLCHRHYQRRKLYDLTLDELRAIEGGAECAICGDPARHVDHCHASGSKRGFLCTSCNFGLGNFRDDPYLLARAAAYLDNPPLRESA